MKFVNSEAVYKEVCISSREDQEIPIFSRIHKNKDSFNTDFFIYEIKFYSIKL